MSFELDERGSGESRGYVSQLTFGRVRTVESNDLRVSLKLLVFGPILGALGTHCNRFSVVSIASFDSLSGFTCRGTS